ncbi:AMP-binding protein [Micromonospora sp. WMMA1363]|uniref:AMP-binding protein n=1 Tax=Micromonospora sp. WMMA1363 TaxID=3053985 RepID=UPI00259D20BA|nr:AMP-binding protein [Micromonospora sp. WMMA1363]MDM4722003.1 AMP-binding protein [Micromonospora sp. WMMA1363]
MTTTLDFSDVRDWLVDPRPDKGVRFLAEGDSWDYHSYADLSLAARRSAAAMTAAGAQPGDVVCLLMPTSYPTLCAYFGAWAAGLTPCMITPPSLTRSTEYVELVSNILRRARPALMVTTERYQDLAELALATADLSGRAFLHGEAEEPIEVSKAGPDDLAILQFTSGSTGVPRGVPVTWRNLAVNVSCTRAWSAWSEDDSMATWLPLYHDMGLIGTLLTAVCSQADLWLMRPAQFLRDPSSWLECMTRATITAAPPFAYEYAVERISAERIAGWDLSGWRTAFVGAQTIDPAVLDKFVEATAAAGFDRSAFTPAYGMAETTLGVTGTDPGVPPLVVQVRPDALRFGHQVELTRQFHLGEEPVSTRAGWLTGCGGPRLDTRISIVDQDGVELPPGRLGEIRVSGETVTAGYTNDADSGGTRFTRDGLRTGDAGFLHAGQLFVLGRMGDSLKIRGRNVYVEDLEAAVVEATGLPANRCVVISAPETERAGVLVLVEGERHGWEESAYHTLRSRLGHDPRIRFAVGGSGLIQRTTSGKPRRRGMWQHLQEGTLKAAIVEPGVPA